MTLRDTQIVILGGSSGIGLATAVAAAEAGAHVTLTGRSADKLAQARERLGAGARCVELDAADEAGTRDLLQSFEHIDHVFITVGALAQDSKLEGALDDYRQALDLRFWGAAAAAKYAAPRMGAGGSITFMSGTASQRPLAGASIGSASTAAVEGLARALALDLAPVRVNAIRPGFVDTPMLDGVLGDNKTAILADIAKTLPVGRIGRPEELAHAVLFLMENGYVTGTALTVDGGGMLV